MNNNNNNDDRPRTRTPYPAPHALRPYAHHRRPASVPCDPRDIRTVGSLLPHDLQAPYWTVTLLGLRSSTIDPGRLRFDGAAGLVGVIDGKRLRVLPTPSAVRPWLDTAKVDGADVVRFELSTGAPVTTDHLARSVRRAAAAADIGAGPVTLHGLRRAAIDAATSRGVDPAIVAAYFGLTGEEVCIDCLGEAATAIEHWHQAELHPARA